MFHSAKKPGQEKNKNKVKFLDSKKDTHSRLKALRSVLDHEHEVKSFFAANYMQIFYVFYEEFTNLESSTKPKGAKVKDELEELLVILEKIFIYLPDEIHSRWQFNSIGLILRKLLHHGNVLSIREQGIRLFMLWLQIMQQNIDEFNLVVFASIVPGLPSPVDKIDVSLTYRSLKAVQYIVSSIKGDGNAQALFNANLDNENEWCVAEGCSTPICPPQQGEKIPLVDELTKKFLERILFFMTRRILDIQWTTKHMRESGFYQVFGHFKRFYLPVIFPAWDPKDHLYRQNPEIIKVPIKEIKEYNPSETTHTILQCQYSVLTWLVNFTIKLKPKTRTFVEDKKLEHTVKDSLSSETGSCKDNLISPTMSSASLEMVTDSPLRQLDVMYQTADIVRAVMYSTQENVLTMYEIFRQCFLMPLTVVDVMDKSLSVFKEWLFKKDDRDKPLFLREPKKTPISLSPQMPQGDIDESLLLRTPSYKEAVRSSENFFFANMPIENAKAGFQQNLRFFISISAQIFYVKQANDTMAQHADICRKVMKTYRNLVLEMTLDSYTWQQLLAELLHIAEYILTLRPPSSRHATLGGQLASYLLQTLFVTWIRASLQVHLAEELWDHLLYVCSRYTGWAELIKEWAGTMETLTRVMARTIYRIDLQNPPLQQLTRKDKVIKRFQRKVSSGDILKKETTTSTSGGKLQLRHTQGKSMPAHTFNTAAVATAGSTTVDLQQPNRQSLIRSASEPGMSALPLSTPHPNPSPHNHVTQVHSESCVPTGEFEVRAESKKLTPHEDSTVKDYCETDHKKTLAEIADYQPNVMSFDSGTNESVFGASMTSSVFRNSLMQGSDTSNKRDMTRLISYQPLKDADSESSSNSLRYSGSTNSMNSFVSESNQNLLANEENEGRGRDAQSRPSSTLQVNAADANLPLRQHEREKEEEEEEEVEIVVGVITPNTEKNLRETELFVSSSAFCDSVSLPENSLPDTLLVENSKECEPISPHASVSSEADLMVFDIEHMGNNSGQKFDGQSIDSRLFSMLYNDSDMKSPSSTSTLQNTEILEGDEGHANNSEEALSLKVHFEEGSMQALYDDEEVEGLQLKIPHRKQSDAKPKSVIEGGTEVGWTPISSVVLWKRMLGVMGNINDIKDAEIHGSVFKHLIDIWLMLENIRKNQGVSIDNKFTPPPPALTPPLFYCAPLCFQAISQDFTVSHKPGRVLAFKLLCMMTTRSHSLKLSNQHITCFYRFLHDGLTGADQDVINAIVSQCSLIYTLELPSSSCLFLDFIQGAHTIVCTQYMQYPRKEAVTLLGSLLCMPGVYPNMKIYQLGNLGTPETALLGKGLCEKILVPLLKAVRNDPSCRARCIAINCLSIFIVQSLEHFGGHQRIYECLALILSSLEFHSTTVSTVALDVLWLLTFYHDKLEAFDKDLPLKIVEAMCMITLHLHAARQHHNSEIPEDEIPEYITKLLLVLLDWVMVIPQCTLLRNRTDQETKITYLGLVMKVFKKCASNASKANPHDRRRSLNVNHIFTGDTRPIKLQRVHNDLGMDDLQGITDDDDTNSFATDDPERKDTMLKLTARFCISQVLNFHQHFPMHGGAVCPGSLVYETDDSDNIETDEQNLLLDSNNMQFLLINGDALLTVIELPQQEGFLTSTNMTDEKTICRMIFRDATGKYAWDVSNLYEVMDHADKKNTDTMMHKKPVLDRKHSRNLSVSSARLTWTSSSVLPTWESVDSNVDRVDQLLRYIGQSSPECLIFPDQQLNVPSPVAQLLGENMQSSAVTCVLKQHNEEENYVHEINNDARITAPEIFAPDFFEASSPFHVSKMLLHQLGYFSWEKRGEYELLERNEKLLREIKYLDKRGSRETHKFAIFYVAPGQEDKHSILSNSQASKKFENFVACLGWEVDLSTHAGFMGGLERNLSTGASAPYFATHSLEIIFHVATRMPGTEEEALKTKLRHLGNDEIHIIWSEHNRDFRRGIINTEFGDVMIIIYPLLNDLYRIQIDRHPKIQPFGPLFDGAIVDGDLLAPLVRCTAINAGRAKRATIPMFNRHYEERARCIREIANHRMRPTTFEDFSAKLFAPKLPEQSSNNDVTDSIQRTHSVPSRSASLKADATSEVHKFLDNTDSNFRARTFSAVPQKHLNTERIYRSRSNNSLNNLNEPKVAADFFSSTELNAKDYKDQRRRSLTKRFRKKASTVDASFLPGNKIGE